MTNKLEITREQLEKCLRDASLVRHDEDKHVQELRALLAAPVVERQEPVALTVWEGPMPESNGKSNFTAILMRKNATFMDGIMGGITIERSEYPDRVRYEADRMRYLIGELQEEPFVLDYDTDKHSGYVRPEQPAPVTVVLPERKVVEKAYEACDVPEEQQAIGWNACLDKVKELNP